MKSLFTSLLLFTILVLNAQTYNSPESVEYDANHQRYIVANTSANNLQQVIPGSAPTLFVSSVPGPYGIAIVGDTVYVCCNSTHLRGYNLTTGALAFDVNLGGIFLNGICTDFAGNIFVTDFTAKKIVRYNIASQQFNYFVGTAMAKTPNGIVFDPFHNRLVVATWNANASILGVNLSDSTVSTLKATNITSFDGIAVDEDGNFYASAWGVDGVYFFDSAFTNAPLQIISFANNTNAADISYNILSDTLAVPQSGTPNTVTFYGFPRPKPTNDFATATVSVSQSICVLQNDLISGNVPLILQSFSSPQLGTAGMNGNCIDYTANTTGNDTITYIVCSVDTPSFCRTGVLIVTNVLGGGNLAPVAIDDTASTIQPNPITVNVAANDVDAIDDTLCVTSIIGSGFFSIDNANCTNIIFAPDSFFVGSDTCVYVICDNSLPSLCDTAVLVITSIANPALLPEVGFISDSTNSVNIFQTLCGSWLVWGLDTFRVNNTSVNADSILWTFTAINSIYPSINFTDSIVEFVPYELWYGVEGIEICLSAFNRFGTQTKCDTFCSIYVESISEISLSNIHLFPNPANNILTIDMQNNSDEITRNYSSIEILNTLGEKQKSVSKKGAGKMVSLDVSDLPNGIYLATIISDKREKRMLGKFTVSR